MTIYRRQRDGAPMIRVRVEHSMDLRALTLALYNSNEELGAELSVRTIRKAISNEMAYHGGDLMTTVADYLHEADEYDSNSLVGCDAATRLEWARRMVVKAYGPEFEQFSASRSALRAFEALAPKDIV
ncbi:hypothetical protein [Streptomyces griseoaurantiacus]|uniref:hypothetical protein n=1 Tax=Streptomyces griseoaurantiacus TaxID=68213 RepID=UPI00368FF145